MGASSPGFPGRPRSDEHLLEMLVDMSREGLTGLEGPPPDREVRAFMHAAAPVGRPEMTAL
jgi:hypothetical protein